MAKATRHRHVRAVTDADAATEGSDEVPEVVSFRPTAPMSVDDSASGPQTGSSVQRGRRPMKEYYIHDSELRGLKKTGAIAAVFFATGSALLGFAVNIYLSMAFADKLAEATKNEWLNYRNIAILAAAFCYCVAIQQSLSGYNDLERIKAETVHGNTTYVPKSRYIIGLFVLAAVVLVALGFFGRGLFF